MTKTTNTPYANVARIIKKTIKKTVSAEELAKPQHNIPATIKRAHEVATRDAFNTGEARTDGNTAWSEVDALEEYAKERLELKYVVSRNGSGWEKTSEYAHLPLVKEHFAGTVSPSAKITSDRKVIKDAQVSDEANEIAYIIEKLTHEEPDSITPENLKFDQLKQAHEILMRAAFNGTTQEQGMDWDKVKKLEDYAEKHFSKFYRKSNSLSGWFDIALKPNNTLEIA